MITTTKTTLSMLCIINNNGCLNLHVHGQCPICNIPIATLSGNNNNNLMMTSSDLTTMLHAHEQKQELNTPVTTVGSTCYLKKMHKKKYKLQQLSSYYTSMRTYIENGLKSIKQINA